MVITLSVINALVFFLISAIHIYWALGGKWGAAYAIPGNMKGQLSFQPGALATLTVAFGLMVFSFLMLTGSGLVSFSPIDRFKDTALYIVSGIFLVRAIGEFRYVGLTKKIRNTAFALLDTRYYTPLCLWLFASILFIAVKN
ncbi:MULTISPECIES: DUF3995 domain-containing protein [Bacteria]|uniref:DUF3995 domain-containing protein n=1 Tax=Nostoc sp. CHAB 5715 TaxID=2780400 RepID=UPI001412980A|nr:MULTISPECIES: DUF3995 domain-containing protein [Bacteria]MCC5623721.1 DUF3995 domain-containing protein [Nostoc sp. CHAB 5715]NBA86698.1 DUF3995 domain-containing protein [Emticicia sp. CRIBPO]